MNNKITREHKIRLLGYNFRFEAGEIHLRPVSSILGCVLSLPTFATHAFTKLNVWEF